MIRHQALPTAGPPAWQTDARASGHASQPHRSQQRACGRFYGDPPYNCVWSRMRQTAPARSRLSYRRAGSRHRGHAAAGAILELHEALARHHFTISTAHGDHPTSSGAACHGNRAAPRCIPNSSSKVPEAARQGAMKVSASSAMRALRVAHRIDHLSAASARHGRPPVHERLRDDPVTLPAAMCRHPPPRPSGRRCRRRGPARCRARRAAARAPVPPREGWQLAGSEPQNTQMGRKSRRRSSEAALISQRSIWARRSTPQKGSPSMITNGGRTPARRSPRCTPP